MDFVFKKFPTRQQGQVIHHNINMLRNNMYQLMRKAPSLYLSPSITPCSTTLFHSSFSLSCISSKNTFSSRYMATKSTLSEEEKEAKRKDARKRYYQKHKVTDKRRIFICIECHFIYLNAHLFVCMCMYIQKITQGCYLTTGKREKTSCQIGYTTLSHSLCLVESAFYCYYITYCVS